MKTYAVIALAVFMMGCEATQAPKQAHSDYVISQDKMKKIVVGGGETVYQAEGKNHGMNSMSFVITETERGGGPPMHVHPVEEAHVVLSGKVKYTINDSVFTVDAPFIVKIPANAPHTFMNVGDTILNLIGVFGQENFGPYQPISDNPLQADN